MLVSSCAVSQYCSLSERQLEETPALPPLLLSTHWAGALIVCDPSLLHPNRCSKAEHLTPSESAPMHSPSSHMRGRLQVSVSEHLYRLVQGVVDEDNHWKESVTSALSVISQVCVCLAWMCVPQVAGLLTLRGGTQTVRCSVSDHWLAVRQED